MCRYKIAQDKWDAERCMYDSTRAYFTMYRMQFFYTAAPSRRESQSSQNIYLLYRIVPAVISVSTNLNLKLSTWNKNTCLMWKNTIPLRSYKILGECENSSIVHPISIVFLLVDNHICHKKITVIRFLEYTILKILKN